MKMRGIPALIDKGPCAVIKKLLVFESRYSIFESGTPMETSQKICRRIAVLLACHNRKDKTISCLRSLRAQSLPGWNPAEEREVSQSKAVDRESHPPPGALPHFYTLQIFLVDDGSTDGTAEAVRCVWPDATIIKGNGKLFWCGGMRVAWEVAAKTDPDYYLLLNDDTIIESDALSELLARAPSPSTETIAVAPIADPDTGTVVFGGHRGHDANPLKPEGFPLACDTMNANCTLVPQLVFGKIGMFHRAYTHAMGDFDYGFTASRLGVKILQAGHVLGTSKPNPEVRTWRDKSLTRRERFRLLWCSPKGLPFLEWLIYARRNEGFLWPYRAISPALRILAGR